MAQAYMWFETIRTWVNTFDEIAPRTIEGVYVVGSVALGDWQPDTSDIDIIAITAEPADEEMAGALRTAHAVFVERCPEPTVDGPFLAWGDLTLSPQGATRPWTLQSQFHHDAECFELNPVTWYTLATYGVRVRGPEPADLQIPVEREAMFRFVVDNARSYWGVVHEQFKAATSELGESDTLPSSVPAWCLLGTCRMLYTASTGDVTSKSGAGLWVAEVVGEGHRAACEMAVELRAQPEQPVTLEALRASVDAMGDVLQRISKLTR